MATRKFTAQEPKAIYRENTGADLTFVISDAEQSDISRELQVFVAQLDLLEADALAEASGESSVFHDPEARAVLLGDLRRRMELVKRQVDRAPSISARANCTGNAQATERVQA